jgi:hypothetical protein
MDLMTAASLCLQLHEKEVSGTLTMSEERRLAEARKFLTDGTIQKTPIKVFDPCGLLED